MTPVFISRLKTVLTALTTIVAISAAAGSTAELPPDAGQYKCYVQEVRGSMAILRFYDPGGLPERFSDDATIARAPFPESERQRIVRVVECIQGDLDFHDPAARSLEQSQPK